MMSMTIIHGAPQMKTFKNIFERIKAICIKYPAFLSGFFICSYLFFCILQYLLKIKSSSLFQSQLLSNIIESFGAFPFMLLLSAVLVKIIEERTKLHKSKEKRILAEHEKELHETQLKTLKEITRVMKHHINNPLAIISLSIGPARKAAGDNQKVIHQLDIIDEALKRITTALADFSKVRQYGGESSDPYVGNIVTPNIQ
jgi:hypothetical protein